TLCLPVLPGVRLCAGHRAGHRLDRRLRRHQPGHGPALPADRSAGRTSLGMTMAAAGRGSDRGLLLLAWLIVAALVAFALVPGWIAPSDPIILDIAHRLQGPSLAHPFGTDEGGRDILSRVVHGARYSLGVSVGIVLAAALFGVAYGAASGMAGRRLDNLLMRVVDPFFGFPPLGLALAVAAGLGRGRGSGRPSRAAGLVPGRCRPGCGGG